MWRALQQKASRKCRAKNAKCDACDNIDHFKKYCKKLGNFPTDNSNQQNQSSSTDSGRMNYAAAVPADFFYERGLLKEYRPPPMQQQIGSMNILRKVPSNAIHISEDGVEIQPNTSTSVSGSVPDPVPSPDFPFLEFPLTEVVNQSQIDFSSISDMLDLRETDISTSSSSYNMDFQGKSQELAASHEEMI